MAVVDDRADARAGRAAWLQTCTPLTVDQLSFHDALDLEDGWSAYQLVVLDGRDDRLDDTASMPGPDGVPVVSHDRFVGPRVAERIRRHCTRDLTRIVLVSAYVRTNALLARRCQEAGVDYLFSLDELNDAGTFVARVLEPDDEHAAAHYLEPGYWTTHGYDGTPSINEAIHAVEASPAGDQVLFDLLGKRFRDTAYQLRRLRERLGRLLALRPPPAGGGRIRHVPKSHLSSFLLRAQGISHRDTDDESPRS